jgi:fucose 4-O-acetylase-like acetyltransferase
LERNRILSEVVEGFVTFIDIWFMPLFFFIAGAAAFFALGRRSSREFAVERAKRLLVPFVFGMLVIVST